MEAAPGSTSMRLTIAATRLMLDVRAARGIDPAHHPRLVAANGNIALTYTPAPGPGDTVIAAGGAIVFVAPEIATRFEHATIDSRSEGDEMFLVVQEPLMSSSAARWLH